MDEKKKFEINDDMLDGVAGGIGEGDTNYEDWKVGDKVTPKSGRCERCGTLSPTATVNEILYMHNRISMTICMDCCTQRWLTRGYLQFKRI